MKIVLVFIFILLPSVSFSEYIDIKKMALKSCKVFNRLRHNISETRYVVDSDNIKLKVGYLYRIIEYRKDYNQLRIEIDYISQGDVKHRWVNRDCFYKR